MKIQSSNQSSILDALSRIDQDTKTKQNSEINFEELLAKDLQVKEQNTNDTIAQNNAIKTNINLLIEQKTQVQKSSDIKQNIDKIDTLTDVKKDINELNNILNQLENYSQELSSNSNNKNLWASLNNIDQTTQKLKSSTTNPNMKNIISELEVLSSTEKTKLNRGDYL